MEASLRRLLATRSPEECRVFSFPTDMGFVATLWCADRLAALTFGQQNAQRALFALDLPFQPADLPNRGVAAALASRLQAYFHGACDDFLDVPVCLDGTTPFQRRALDACRRIPFGQTRTYHELANEIGAPKAARAIGNAMARNRVPLVVPCHRVLGGKSQLGGYSASGGVKVKRRLLELEGVV